MDSLKCWGWGILHGAPRARIKWERDVCSGDMSVGGCGGGKFGIAVKLSNMLLSMHLGG